MAFIKEESEDVKIEETLGVKQEDAEEQTDVMPLKEECIVPNETEEKEQNETHRDFKTEEESFSWPQIKETLSLKTAQKTGNLNDHMKIHTGQKPFTCQECGKGFKHDVHLEVHMRVHTGEKPFTCQQCGKRFSRTGSLNKHMPIHTREMYTCPQCGKSFNLQGRFQAHIRVHTGEKPYTCQQCGKSFTQKAHHNKHMKRLHGIFSTQS